MVSAKKKNKAGKENGVRGLHLRWNIQARTLVKVTFAWGRSRVKTGRLFRCYDYSEER